MSNITGVLDNIFNFFSINLFGSTVLFSMFLLVILMIFLFQMGASRFVLLAFIVPLLIILTNQAGWITDSWIGYAGMILVAFLLFIILRRIFSE
jgi:hypothetical protein